MSSRKEYRSWSPHQPFLFPPSPTDWLPEGHLAYFILDVVAELDIRSIDYAIQAKDARGTRPYNPRMMLALLVYGYCVGVFSSRKLARATYDRVDFRVIAGGTHPHFTRINAFRKDHLASFKGLFLQVLRLCQAAGLVKLGHVAIDGTKVQGNASKHKAMSYERMEKRQAQLKREIDELVTQAERTDAEEDAEFGVGQDEEDIPAELHRRENRLQRIQAAKAALEAEAAEARAQVLREQAQRARQRATTHPDPTERKRAATYARNRESKADNLAPKKEDEDSSIAPFTTEDGLPKHRVRATVDGKPHPKAQRNFTDPDSRIMEQGGSFIQGYNCQLAVDEEHPVIVAEAVTNQPPDNGNLVPMARIIVQNCDNSADRLTGDAGYWAPEAPAACEELGFDPHISTRRRKHHETTACEESDPPPDDANALEKMRAKLRTPEGDAVYRRRKAVVEPVNGQIKEARGFRRFSLRGLFEVQGEWTLVCLSHNLLKLFRSTGIQLDPATA